MIPVLADPSGPPDTRPPNKPPPPPPPPKDLAADLDQLVQIVGILAAQGLLTADPADRMQLTQGLRTARHALANIQTPARRHLSSAAAVAGGPVQTSRLQTGERLTPGSVAAFSGAATESAGSVVDPSAGAISGPGGKAASAASGPDRAGGPPAPGAGTFALPQPSTWPGRPFPVYEVPTP